MAKLRRYIQLIRSLPPREVLRKVKAKFGQTITSQWRAAQAQLFGTHISDAQLRAALIPSLQDSQALLSFLCAGERPCFFIDARQREAVLAAFRHHCPMADTLTLVAANRACDHIFDLLGSGPTRLGDRIDWHKDFKTGHHYNPRQYYANIHPANYPGGHDIKVPWELSRCQHFAWLGQAYWLTSDERYAQEFVAQVTDWIKQNPPKLGVNWTTAMDVAIRAVNWLWGYAFFRLSPSLSDEFILKFHQSLLVHGRHIRANLEWSETLTGNHYLSDIVGLLFLGVLCPQFREAAEWRAFALQELWREMPKQFYPDGVSFEASISYHRLAAELFLSAVVLCQLNNIPVPTTVMERLEKMLEFVQHYTRSDGSVPLIGDGDNGRLQRLKVWANPEREWIDHRHLLAIGAVLFDREDFGRAAGDEWEEAIWMWGERASAFKERLNQSSPLDPALRSRAFPEGGVYIMRDHDKHLIVEAGPNGQNGNGGHAHNDTLSFELYVGGQAWIVDPGTYVYTPDYAARNQFRSSVGHNVVVVDQCEINRIDKRELFSLANDALPILQVWDSSEGREILVAGHTGYQRLKPPLTCRRLFWFDKQAGRWLIRDDVRGEGRHTYQAYFHLAPCQAEIDGSLVWLVSRPGTPGLALYFVGLPPGSMITCMDGWISTSYGRQTRAPVLLAQGAFEDEVQFSCLLVPWPNVERPAFAALAEAYQSILKQMAEAGEV